MCAHMILCACVCTCKCPCAGHICGHMFVCMCTTAFHPVYAFEHCTCKWSRISMCICIPILERMGICVSEHTCVDVCIQTCMCEYTQVPMCTGVSVSSISVHGCPGPELWAGNRTPGTLQLLRGTYRHWANHEAAAGRSRRARSGCGSSSCTCRSRGLWCCARTRTASCPHELSTGWHAGCIYT